MHDPDDKEKPRDKEPQDTPKDNWEPFSERKNDDDKSMDHPLDYEDDDR